MPTVTVPKPNKKHKEKVGFPFLILIFYFSIKVGSKSRRTTNLDDKIWKWVSIVKIKK